MTTHVASAADEACRRWMAALDAYEAHLARQHDHLSALLADGGATSIDAPPAFVPVDLGPLPADLVERARQLQTRTAELQAIGAAARAQLDRPRIRRRPSTASADLVDRSL